MSIKAPVQHTNYTPSDHYLLGIGASAGGLEAIHELFDHFPNNSSFSFVIVQHLSPDHKSLMTELLSKHTSMQVHEAEDNMLTRPNCIYVLPSGKQLTVKHGRLKLKEKERNREPNFAIDVFLESLAQDFGKYAIGIILSGTGTDGTKGAKAIKKAGGMMVVQDPGTAKFDGMPRSAIDNGTADYVLMPKQMPDKIIAFTKKLPLINSNSEDADQSHDDSLLKEILGLVRNYTQTDFTNYKQATIKRRIQKRMDTLKLKTLDSYLEYMKENTAEITHLSQEFYINVTQFFRDREAFDILEKEVIPSIIESKPEGAYIKAWVAACSTGEEVYSLAILFQEAYEKLDQVPNIKLFATDIDQDAISKASKGVFPASIEEHVSKERLKKYFTYKNKQYTIKEATRKMVVFAQHDLQKDPPLSRMDFISCRNMLIYLNPGLQNKILGLFPYSLNLHGYLFLGPSEHLGEMRSYFGEVNRKWKIYKKIKESRGLHQTYGINNYTPITATGNQEEAVQATNMSRYNEAFMDSVAEDFKVTGFYIDENFQLLHGIGDINRFLQFPDKRLHFNLLKMVPEELAVTISVGTRKALKNNKKVVARQVVVKSGKKKQLVQVSIKPLQNEDNLPVIVMVLLQEVKELAPITTKVPDSNSIVNDPDYYQQLATLEQELKEARENLSLTVQDLSTSNEELQSSNEELMSSNEELQSSNEEMQSLNEELHTVNTEHQLKIKELQELNEDLDNYIRSSNIGQLFIDHHLVIRKFTPSITELINVIDSDVGRPIHHLSHNLKYNKLFENIKHVNNTSEDVEHEIETTDGKFFLMRIIPYLKHDGSKDGVVVSFVDVSTLKELSNVVQGVLNSSLSHILAFEAIRDNNKQIKDLAWTMINSKAEKFIGKSLDELKESTALSTLPFLKKGGLYRKLVTVVDHDKPLHTEQYIEMNNTSAWYEISAVKMGDGLAVTLVDITEKKQAEEKILVAYEELITVEESLIKLNNELEDRVQERTKELGASEERFRLVSMATNDVIWDWSLITNEIWWSESLEKVLGYTPEEMQDGFRSWSEKIHPDDRNKIVDSLNAAINMGQEQWLGEYRIKKMDGTYAYVANRAYIMQNEYKIPFRVLASCIDLTDLKSAQEKLQNTNEHLRKVNADLDTFVYTASHDLKAPVANIEGLLLLLEDQIQTLGPIPGEPVEPVFVMMKDAISRFKNVIKDLTDIARVQRDVIIESEQVNLQEVLVDLKKNMHERFDKDNAIIEADFSKAPSVTFSKKNLYSIFYNLLSNAIKYRHPDRSPQIKIESERLDDQILITVKDNGLGFSADNLEKVFTLFKRFHSHVEGTGMGLYIVKRLMNNSGGSVKVESTLGEGSTFKLYFNVAEGNRIDLELEQKSLEEKV